MENNSDREYNMDLENHPIIRLMMRSIQMIPTNENDILQSTFDEQTINSIPTCNKFIENLNEMYITEEDVKNGLSCSICQEEFELNDKCIELPCKPHKHYFHIKNENCDGVLPWLSENNTCPMCRCEFPKSEEQTEEQSNIQLDEPTEEQPALPNIEEILLQAITRRNNINIISSNPDETNLLPNLLFPNIAVDTVRDGFSDREVDEAIRRSLES